jgi:hypothetical protein
MEMSLLVFLLGSSASYFPIYWALTRVFASRNTRTRSNSPSFDDHEAKRQFLDCLRREAVARVDAALDHAAAQVRLSMSERQSAISSLDHGALERLGEVRRMVQLLFPTDATASFDKVIAALNRAPSSRRNELSASILELKTKLVATPDPKKTGRARVERWLDMVRLRLSGSAAFRPVCASSSA